MFTSVTAVESRIAAGFHTKSSQKDALDILSRRYEVLRKQIMHALLSERDERGAADVDPLYWDLPYDLHNWREAKHADPRFAAENTEIAALVAMRERVKATPVDKGLASKRDTRVVVGSRTQLRGTCSCCGSYQAVDENGHVADHGYEIHWNQQYGRCPGSRVPHFGLEAGRLWLADTVVRWEQAARSATQRLAEVDPTDRKTVAALTKDVRAYTSSAAFGKKRVAEWCPSLPREVIVEKRETHVHLAARVFGEHAAACCASAMGALKFRGQTTTVEAEVTCPRCRQRILDRKG